MARNYPLLLFNIFICKPAQSTKNTYYGLYNKFYYAHTKFYVNIPKTGINLTVFNSHFN